MQVHAMSIHALVLQGHEPCKMLSSALVACYAGLESTIVCIHAYNSLRPCVPDVLGGIFVSIGSKPDNVQARMELSDLDHDVVGYHSAEA